MNLTATATVNERNNVFNNCIRQDIVTVAFTGNISRDSMEALERTLRYASFYRQHLQGVIYRESRAALNKTLTLSLPQPVTYPG